MADRVTIMISSDLDRRIRNRQANIIKATGESCSYSRVFNEVMKMGLKKPITLKDSGGERGGKRVTVMINDDVKKLSKIRLGEKIIECAKAECELPSMSFSSQINSILKKGFGIK